MAERRLLSAMALALVWVALTGGRASAAGAGDGDDFGTAAYVRPQPAELKLPTEPGDHKLKFTTTLAGHRVKLSYLLHLPPGYGNPKHPAPMLVFLHGAGECGTDLGAIYIYGPMSLFKPGGDIANPTLAATWPFVTLCPQCPPRGETWSDEPITRAVVELIAAVVHSSGGRVDADRVYGTGLSMGGLGTWCVAEAAPDLFAAIAPISAMPWQPEVAADRLNDVAVWAVTGLDDDDRFVDGGHSMEHALARCRADDRFTFYAHVGHEVYNVMYDSTDLYEWLLSHRRATPGTPAVTPTSTPTSSPVKLLSIPTAPGHYRLSFDTTIDDQPIQLDYGLLIPPAAPTPAGKRAALLFLSERDTIGAEYNGVCCHGPELAVERDPALKASYPFIIISPRLPINCRWTDRPLAKAVSDLMDHVSAALSLDPDRTCISGVNGGAFAAWRYADAAPGKFAAMVWVSTERDAVPPSDAGKLVQSIPGRAFALAANDRAAARLKPEFAKSNRDWALIELPATATPSDTLPAYADHSIVDWLAHQCRSPG